VETTVVGCRCQYGNQSQLSAVYRQNFRPTYWDGTMYKAPEMLDSTRQPTAGPVVLGRNDDPQSDLCTDCCRDHHDATSDAIKFDPFRSTHDHYLNSNLGAAVTTGEYSEACRIIRVDGFWRVATDARIEHFDYIGTGPGTTDQAPDPIYADAYRTFVVDYLRNRFVGPPDGATAVQRYAQSPLKKPAQIAIQADASDRRYLHSHAVLVDHIETVAQQKIDSVLNNCTMTNRIDCLLPYIPFTTVNMTELAAYAPSNTQVIGVVTGGANFADTSIVQGLVTGRTTATDGQTATADATLKYSNTALTGVLPIDPDDATLLPTAQQEFRVGNTLPPTGAAFAVQLGPTGSPGFSPAMTDGSPANDPAAMWTIGGTSGPCGSTTSGLSATAAPCQTNSPLGVAVDVTVSGYNLRTTAPPATINCTTIVNTNGNPPSSFSGTTPAATPQPVCKRYSVASVYVDGVLVPVTPVVTNSGRYAEASRLSLPLVPPSPQGQVLVNFGAATDVPATLQSCELNKVQGNWTISVANWSDPCQ
jgi:hypothetical protein